MGGQRYLDLAREALQRSIANQSEQYKYITCDDEGAFACETSDKSERSPDTAPVDWRPASLVIAQQRWRVEVRKRWPRRALEAGIECARRRTDWPNEWGRSQAEVIDAYLDLLQAWTEPLAEDSEADSGGAA